MVLFSQLASSSAAAGPEKKSAEKKVLIIGIDGCRRDALEAAHTPHLDALIRAGAIAENTLILGDRYRDAETGSGPGWSSILTGVWADKHGVNDNSFQDARYDEFPHFFGGLKRQRRTPTTCRWSRTRRSTRNLDPWPRIHVLSRPRGGLSTKQTCSLRSPLWTYLARQTRRPCFFTSATST